MASAISCAQWLVASVTGAGGRGCTIVPSRVITFTGRNAPEFFGVRESDGKPYTNVFFFNGGMGATAVKDGESVLSWPSNISSTPVEVAERNSPLFFHYKRLSPGSGGDGQYRGGVGSILRLRVDTTEAGVANTAGDGVRHPSYGILGGKDGLPHRYRLLSHGTTRVLKTKEVGIPVRPRDVFFVESAGGGGWGPSSKRRPEARASDAANGFAARPKRRPRA